MALVEYSVDEHVGIITLNSGENRFNPAFLEACLDSLEKVETDTDSSTLVVTSSHEKIFSNGLDLEWLISAAGKKDMEAVKEFFYLLNRLFIRILTCPMIAIAAVSGHAFAAGAIMCCAFDFRFMRSERGFFCLPEIDLNLPFLPGMLALLKKAIPLYKLEEMQYTGKRLTAQECEEHHMITKAAPGDRLMDETLSFAKGLKKNREIIREMKTRLNRKIVHTLEVEDAPYIEALSEQILHFQKTA